MTTTSSTSSTSTSTTNTYDSASIGSALLSSLGGGSGINMTSMATAIAQAQYMTQTISVESQLSDVALKISQASTLKSDLLSLSSSLGTLVEGTDLLPQPTVTNSSVASATLPSGSAGSSASYSLEVTQLATSQVLATASQPTNAAMKGGTLTFNFGTITNGSFTAGSASPTTVTIKDGASLSDVATAINSAGMGVTAYIASSTNGQQLVIKGSEGAANAFTITGSDSSGATSTNTSLSAFAYDPASGTNGAGLIQSSGDAAYKLDGISRTSSSNTISYAAPGLSLKLTGTNSGAPTTITYSDPSSSIKTTMSNLVAALNSLVSEVNTDTSASGSLYGDTAARAVKKAFSTLASTTIMPNATNGQPSKLSDLGVKLNKDGTFTLDTTALTTALNTNTSAVAAMFTSGVNGVYSTFFSMVNDLTTSTNSGSLAGSITQYSGLQSRLTDKESSIAALQATLRDRLVTQYAAANSVVASYNSTASYLTNQIAQWNKTG